jgi:metallophosphoesterase (TIGR00282 family)
MRVIFLGDIFGKAGRQAIKKRLPGLIKELAADFVIVNGENIAGGLGITPVLANELFALGVHVISTGNHIWQKKEVYPFLDVEPRLLRPANFNDNCPGKGLHTVELPNGKRFTVINLIGRVFMPQQVDDPFAKVIQLLEQEDVGDYIFVDMHAETTSEKTAMAYHLDGRVSAVAGTHTHVQTSDERILAGGTGFICDAGMCGPHDSVIGVKAELIVKRFKTGLPVTFKPSSSGVELQGALFVLNSETGHCESVQRIKEAVSL